MKHKYIYTIAVLLTVAITIGACSKKERSPRLIVHVQEADGTPADGATVHAWPGGNAGQPGSVIDDEMVDQTQKTDGAGDAYFEFEFSVVLDVDVVYYKNYLDPLLAPVTDTLSGHRVVKIESVRQKSENNDHHEMVEVK
ncbi:MAG: hypothetical protein COB15_06275 [Flavobacteriales bacterium]|nr:MAG: hypothetical protein COB15_06275 [Flavobacteriales bacterium]